MLLTNEQGSQARLTSLRYSRLHTTAVLEVTRGETVQTITLQVDGETESRAQSMVMAMARLQLGAVVLDGADYRALWDSVDAARGLPAEVAPAHTAALLGAIAAGQQQRLAGYAS